MLDCDWSSDVCSSDLLVRSGIGHIGNTSWTVMSAAFQDGECVATCDTVVVTHGTEGRRRIDDFLRTAMEANFVQRD
jgi:acyl-CoA thioester hydrolase